MAAVCKNMGTVWVVSSQFARNFWNKQRYTRNNLWINFNPKLQNYTTGLDKQKFTSERLRHLLSALITRTECAFPSADWEKKYSSKTVDIAL